MDFKGEVKQIIRRGGGKPQRSQILDGVFFSSLLRITTLQRSRDFDLDRVSDQELHDIAETVRRPSSNSCPTFDYPERPWHRVNAVELEVPGVEVGALRDGFLANLEARGRLQGGSVTLDGRLILVASLDDLALAKRFVTEIGGDLRHAAIRLGRLEFVGRNQGRRQSQRLVRSGWG